MQTASCGVSMAHRPFSTSDWFNWKKLNRPTCPEAPLHLADLFTSSPATRHPSRAAVHTRRTRRWLGRPEDGADKAREEAPAEEPGSKCGGCHCGAGLGSPDGDTPLPPPPHYGRASRWVCQGGCLGKELRQSPGDAPEPNEDPSELAGGIYPAYGHYTAADPEAPENTRMETERPRCKRGMTTARGCSPSVQPQGPTAEARGCETRLPSGSSTGFPEAKAPSKRGSHPGLGSRAPEAGE